MIGWIVRALLLISGTITGWFIARDSLKFDIVQMVIAILLLTMIVFIIAFWRPFFYWFKGKFIKTK